MDIDKLLATLPLEVRDSPVLQGLKVLFQTVLKELQDTKEQLAAAKAKIQSLEDELRKLHKLPKRPTFRPNDLEG